MSYFARGANGHRTNQLRQQIRQQVEDGACCHICGLPIDLSIDDISDDGHFEVDHVIPVCVAPELEYEISNCAPAHRICNASEGIKTTWRVAAMKEAGIEINAESYKRCERLSRTFIKRLIGNNC